MVRKSSLNGISNLSKTVKKNSKNWKNISPKRNNYKNDWNRKRKKELRRKRLSSLKRKAKKTKRKKNLYFSIS